jgi:hypothetical protein
MPLYKRCPKCDTHDVTVALRSGLPANLAYSCVSCYTQNRTSSTRKVDVETRTVEDRYTALARRHGLA